GPRRRSPSPTLPSPTASTVPATSQPSPNRSRGAVSPISRGAPLAVATSTGVHRGRRPPRSGPAPAPARAWEPRPARSRPAVRIARGGGMTTLTAQERRAEAARRYHAYLASCPARRLLDRIGDKWVTLVLSALRSEEHTSELQSRENPVCR